jgi:integrase
VELAASALRSFFRFLRVEGLREDRLEDVVPMVPRRGTGLARHLDPGRFERLIASLDSSSPRGLRDRAIILCIARLRLRASEVVQLRLEDVDWRNAVVRVRVRKTSHGALLPLTAEVGTALSDYLQHARPDTLYHSKNRCTPVSCCSLSRLGGGVVLVDHAPEYPAASNGCVLRSLLNRGQSGSGDVAGLAVEQRAEVR